MLGSCKAREIGKRTVVWRAHLTLLLLRAEKGMQLGESAEPMIRLVDEACNKMTQYSTAEQDLMRNYIEALQDIAEAAPKENISLHTLLGKEGQKRREINEFLCNT